MKNYLRIFAFLIFCNLFFAITSLCLGLGRPVVNLDYLFLLGFYFFPNQIIRSSLLFISFYILYFIDLLLLVLQIFPFIRLTDIFYLSAFIFNGPILYRTLLLVVAANFFISFFIIRDYLFKKIKLSCKQFIFIFSFIIVLLFTKHLLNPLSKNIVYGRFDTEWVNSQLLFFIKFRHSSFIEAIDGDATKLKPSPFDSATKPLFNQLIRQQHLSKRVLLIVNESWGETYKPKDQQAILTPIYQKNDKLDFIQQGSFNFIGATVAGEIRELCQKQPTTFNLKEAQSIEFKDCLPNQFKKLGYQTYATHGAMSVMYDRSRWYPKAGFDHLYFFEQLQHAGSCRAFSGRCDVQLIPHIKKQLMSSDKSFVYWMTLNTHAPYDDYIFIKGFDCAALRIKEATETCLNYKLQYQFFSALSELIDDPDMRGVEIYVAGDHSPPMFNISDNFFSFKGSDVAWIHFKIKD